MVEKANTTVSNDTPGIPLGGVPFKLAWSQIVASAWGDEELTKELLNDIPSPRDPEEYQKFIREQFSRYHGSIPHDINVTVIKADPNDKWNPAERTWTLRGANFELPLPPAPEVKQQAVALASYESINSSYPFSCAC